MNQLLEGTGKVALECLTKFRYSQQSMCTLLNVYLLCKFRYPCFQLVSEQTFWRDSGQCNHLITQIYPDTVYSRHYCLIRDIYSNMYFLVRLIAQ